jgi:hypothetical protein
LPCPAAAADEEIDAEDPVKSARNAAISSLTIPIAIRIFSTGPNSPFPLAAMFYSIESFLMTL